MDEFISVYLKTSRRIHMKDAKNHLKHLQKKVIQSARKEETKKNTGLLSKEERVVEFKRPKTVLNKRKIA
ncbi:putative uncharacterized protein [Waddlia chondrophila 2032/99]|nr:putative uncharacterized protein [Waddlia chondrophila 2032/99]